MKLNPNKVDGKIIVETNKIENKQGIENIKNLTK